MADPVTDPTTIAVVLVGVALVIAAGFFEMRFLRKKMKTRRIRAAKKDTELPDEAHNAVVSTKAIATTLERQGVRSAEVTQWIRDAETASEHGNYRVAKDLAGRAKDRLLVLKSELASKGEVAKLEQLAAVGGDQTTTKERLQKEVPSNMPQSKFSIELAESALETARAGGRDVAQATELFEAAKTRFEARDYDGALTMARLSKRASEGKKVEVPVVKPSPAPAAVVIAEEHACPTCGASLKEDDVFCRKCGMRLGPRECASCGASLLADDEFCAKCGVRVSR
jgi:Double zinc ribbon